MNDSPDTRVSHVYVHNAHDVLSQPFEPPSVDSPTAGLGVGPTAI